jgi:hypothetical protein
VYVSSERALHVAYGGHEELVMDTTRFVKEARRSSIFCTEVVADFEGFAFGPTDSVIEGPANVAPTTWSTAEASTGRKATMTMVAAAKN